MSKLEQLIAELCPDGVEYVKLDDICHLVRGRVMSKEYLRDNEGVYPVYSANNGIFGYINSYDFDSESITWTTDGANAGSVFYHINEQFSNTNVCGKIRVLDADCENTKFYITFCRLLQKNMLIQVWEIQSDEQCNGENTNPPPAAVCTA